MAFDTPRNDMVITNKWGLWEFLMDDNVRNIVGTWKSRDLPSGYQVMT